MNFSEVEDRLDPQYFFSKNNLHLANNTIFPVYPIAQVLDLQRGKFGHRPRNDPKLYNGQYPFIQTGDIVKASLNNLPIEFSQTLNELGLKTSRLVSEKVVVLTIAANIGYTAILDYSACFPDSLIAIKPKEEQTLYLEYIDIYFKSIRQYLDDLAPQAAQKNINYQQLAKIPFVVPPQKRQQEIIELKHKNNILANQKLKQSQTLLNSISDYLLEKLGITVPQVDNSLSSRIFICQSSELFGMRWDAENKQEKYKRLYHNLQNGKFPVAHLGSLIEFIESGSRPSGGISDISEGVLSLGGEHISQKMMLDVKTPKFISIDFHQKHLETEIQLNDVLLVKDGATTGKVAIVEHNEFVGQNINEHLFMMRFSKDVNPHFVLYFLYSEIGQRQIQHGITGATVTGITKSVVKNLKIPLPDIETQKDIVAHIKQIRKQAQNLEQQAKDLLQQTQQEIEKMILGN